jgi:hypothetical protein
VMQLVEALRYEPKGHGFDSRWCHWNFFLHIPSGRTMVLGSSQLLTEMSTINISLGLPTLSPTCVECLDICEHQPSGIPTACNRSA